MEQYPLHAAVWFDRYETLKVDLDSKQYDIEACDPRGRTPLHLAVSLGRIRCTRLLLEHGANCNADNAGNWKPHHEAIALGDPDLIGLVLKYRDWQVLHWKHASMPLMLRRLKDTPDFYVEMEWKFTSWVPLVSRMCPSDTYKVWKRGSNLRVDTTLVGFEGNRWIRGNMSFIFKGTDEHAEMIELDHERQTAVTQTMSVARELPSLESQRPDSHEIADRMTMPLTTSYLDVEKIEFERSKSGIWGFRSEKSETISGHDCKVHVASNVQLVTKNRSEHLTEEDRKEAASAQSFPLKSLLSLAEERCTEGGTTLKSGVSGGEVTPEEYFAAACDLQGRDIGLTRDVVKKVQKLKASLWLASDYPLSLPEQAVPVIELMSANSAHFARLKDFITLQIPAGFPVKIEIPLFHVLNASITFSNIHGTKAPAPGVTCVPDSSPPACSVDDSVFDVPAHYRTAAGGTTGRMSSGQEEEDALLQLAIQQSLMDSQGKSPDEEVTFYEALGGSASRPGGGQQAFRPLPSTQEDRMLQMALEASLLDLRPSTGDDAPLPGNTPDVEPSDLSGSNHVGNHVTPSPTSDPPAPTEPQPVVQGASGFDAQVALALELSSKEDKVRKNREEEEEEELQRILALSLTEK